MEKKIYTTFQSPYYKLVAAYPSFARITIRYPLRLAYRVLILDESSIIILLEKILYKYT